MSWQLCCHDMCKIVTWSVHFYTQQCTFIFARLISWAHPPFVWWLPGIKSCRICIQLWPVKHWSHGTMVAILQMTFSNVFSWNIICVKFSLKLVAKGLIDEKSALVQGISTNAFSWNKSSTNVTHTPPNRAPFTSMSICNPSMDKKSHPS